MSADEDDGVRFKLFIKSILFSVIFIFEILFRGLPNRKDDDDRPFDALDMKDGFCCLSVSLLESCLLVSWEWLLLGVSVYIPFDLYSFCSFSLYRFLAAV